MNGCIRQSMNLYLVQLSDGNDVDVRLVAAKREVTASTWGELQAARLSRMVGRTWKIHSVARISEVEVADDHDVRMRVNLEDVPGELEL